MDDPSLSAVGDDTQETLSASHKQGSSLESPVHGQSPDGAQSMPADRITDKATATTINDSEIPTMTQPSRKRRPKRMTILTVKFHALGHYPSTIRHFGPTESVIRQNGRPEVAKGTRAERDQVRASRNPDIHHYIGTWKNAPVSLGEFMPNGGLFGDVAALQFIRRLKQHILPRFVAAMRPDLTGQSLQELMATQCWSNVTIKGDRIYTHKIMRIKYTTYDARRDEDIIHLETDQCNLMLGNPEFVYGSTTSPFQYCKVIAILHAEVGYAGALGRLRDSSQYLYTPLEILWVRWYDAVPGPGQAASVLNKVKLRPIDKEDGHGFIDPLNALRACHLIPQFALGRRFPDGHGKSQLAQDEADWECYYVNHFVDRDMFMRYHWGLAVGHSYARRDAVAANKKILDRHAAREQEFMPADETDATTGAPSESEGGSRLPVQGDGISQGGASCRADSSLEMGMVGEALATAAGGMVDVGDGEILTSEPSGMVEGSTESTASVSGMTGSAVTVDDGDGEDSKHDGWGEDDEQGSDSDSQSSGDSSASDERVDDEEYEKQAALYGDEEDW
ncbi:hypothetical protein NMY22_g10496 [Coprinellus aureogranulatus]|nr:hypothetical protein NMY22_g10496 [Coprinellus aureogranulatus]